MLELLEVLSLDCCVFKIFLFYLFQKKKMYEVCAEYYSIDKEKAILQQESMVFHSDNEWSSKCSARRVGLYIILRVYARMSYQY